MVDIYLTAHDIVAAACPKQYTQGEECGPIVDTSYSTYKFIIGPLKITSRR